MAFVRPLASFALCSVLVSGSALADWTGGLEFGIGSDQSPGMRLHATKTGNPLSHNLYLDWIFESGSSSYRLGYNPTYTISQSVFSFGQFSIEQDDPGGIAREVNARVGVGNHLFRTKRSRFTIQTGIGGSEIQIADSTKERNGYFFAGGVFTSKLVGLLKLDAVLESRVADSQTVTNGEAGVSFRVGPNTAIKYAYSVKRYDFDESREDIVNENSFVTMTYGF